MMAASADAVPVCHHTPVPPIINPNSRERCWACMLRHHAKRARLSLFTLTESHILSAPPSPCLQCEQALYHLYQLFIHLQAQFLCTTHSKSYGRSGTVQTQTPPGLHNAHTTIRNRNL